MIIYDYIGEIPTSLVSLFPYKKGKSFPIIIGNNIIIGNTILQRQGYYRREYYKEQEIRTKDKNIEGKVYMSDKKTGSIEVQGEERL